MKSIIQTTLRSARAIGQLALPLVLLLLLLGARAARAQSNLGIGTAAPDASALVEMQSANKGALLPRLALQSLSDAATVAAPAAALLVFNTNAALPGGTGFYYNAGTPGAPTWTRLNTGAAGAGDNLGNHTATQALNLGANALVGSGNDLTGTLGLGVRADGGLNLGQSSFNNNIMIGYEAGRLQQSTLIGFGSQYIGYQSGRSNTGFQNQFSGYQSGYSNTTGGGNYFSGSQAGYANTIGSQNHFSGAASGIANLDGNENTFVGPGSGVMNTSGSKNVFLGKNSGSGNVQGSNNLALGWNAGFPTANLTNASAIGYNAKMSQSNSMVLGDGNIKVGIGVNAPAYTLDVVGTINASGQVRANNVVLSSDRRFKQGIHPLAHALDKLVQLRGVGYTFRQQEFAARNFPAGAQIGLVAQELELVYPELVSTAPDGYKAVNYAQLTPVLIEAIKELKAENDALKTQATASANRADRAEAATASFGQRLQALEAAAPAGPAGRTTARR